MCIEVKKITTLEKKPAKRPKEAAGETQTSFDFILWKKYNLLNFSLLRAAA
jgi:hypothetical protein